MKRLMAIILCGAMLLGTVTAFASEPDESKLFYTDFEGALPASSSAEHLDFVSGIEGIGGSFDGTSSGTYIKAPDNITANVTDFTMAAWVKFDSIVSWERIFDFGSGTDNYFFFGLNYDGYLRFESKVAGSTVQNMTSTDKMKANEWMYLAIVQEGAARTIYINGEAAVVATGITHMMRDMGATVQNYIGRSQFNDPRLCATLDNVAFYNRALGAADIAALALPPTVTAESAAAKLEIPNADNVRDNITLPLEIDGATVTWQSSKPLVVSDSVTKNGTSDMAAGVVVRQETEQDVTLSATVTLGEESATREFNLKVMPKAAIDDMTAYIYAYFRGNVNGAAERLSVHLAFSRDGVTWSDLNANLPVLEAHIGTGCIRDPYLVRAPGGDKFYLFATDLNTQDGGGWDAWSKRGSKSLIVWESDNLVDWSEPWKLKVADENIGCAWAPECIFDETTGEYLVYFAGKDLDAAKVIDTVFMVKTRDFRTLTTKPVVFVGGNGSARIDTSMIKAQDGKYYQFSKRDSNYIEMCVGDAAMGPFTTVSTFNLGNIAGVEGPAIFKLNGDNTTYCLMLDDYSKYVPYFTDDLASGIFTKNPASVMPTGPKHGVVLPITEAEAVAIETKWGSLMEDEARATKDADAIFYGADLSAVKANLTLPTAGTFGSTILWQSSNEAVITPEGVVTRPAMGERDATVTLSATVTYGEKSVVREFTAVVKAQMNEWISTADWSFHSLEKEAGEVIFQYDITPSALTDGLVAICAEGVTPTAWGNPSIVVRLQPGGTMDAHNGTAFTSTNPVTYKAGETYHIRIKTDVAQNKFNVYVINPEGVTTLLAKDFSYRTAAGALDKVVVRGGSGIAAGLFTISDFDVFSSNACLYEFDITETDFTVLTSATEEGGMTFVAQYDNDGVLVQIDTKAFAFGTPQRISGTINSAVAAEDSDSPRRGLWVFFFDKNLSPQ